MRQTPRCESCGRGAGLHDVQVRARAGAQRALLRLCGRCLQEPNAVWRRRWRMVISDEAQAA